MNELDLDENLWFFHKGCEGKHYLVGNPHTFTGRIMAWCPIKKRSFFVSKSEIEDKSEQSDYWIKGFLTGNQPAPPTDQDGSVGFENVNYLIWKKKIEEFEKSGFWENEE